MFMGETVRIRTLKPEWLADEKLGSLSDSERVLTVGLILMADDYGRGKANPALIRSTVWPYVDPPESLQKITERLQRLSTIGFIRLYEVDSQHYYEVCNWSKHQKISHPGRYMEPSPPEDSGESPEDSGESPEDSGESPKNYRPDLNLNLNLNHNLNHNQELRARDTDITKTDFSEYHPNETDETFRNVSETKEKEKEKLKHKRSQDSVGFPGMSRDVTGQCRISGHVTQTDQNRPESTRPEPTIKSESEDIRRVFAFWVEEFWSRKGPEPKLDRNRRGKIAGRLKDGFTVDDLCNAIRGCKSSPFHMGENDDGRRHTSIDLIFRNREKTEGFIAMFLNPKSVSRKGPAKPTPPEEWTEEDLEDDTEEILSGGGWEEYERRKREGIPI